MNKHPLFVSNELKMATGWGRASKVAQVLVCGRVFEHKDGKRDACLSLEHPVMISNKHALQARREKGSIVGLVRECVDAEAKTAAAGAGMGMSASGRAALGGSCWFKMQIKYALSIISGQELWEVSY